MVGLFWQIFPTDDLYTINILMTLKNNRDAACLNLPCQGKEQCCSVHPYLLWKAQSPQGYHLSLQKINPLVH